MKPPIVNFVNVLLLLKGGKMPLIKIKEDIYYLLYNRAKREDKKLEALLNELLHKVLWNEPALLFRGKYYQVQPDLFGENEPKPGDLEE